MKPTDIKRALFLPILHASTMWLTQCMSLEMSHDELRCHVTTLNERALMLFAVIKMRITSPAASLATTTLEMAAVSNLGQTKECV